MLNFTTKTTPTSVFVEVKDQGEVIGLARAYGDSISMMEVVHTYQCSDDLIDISYEYPQVMDGENLRILEVNVVSLSKEYHGVGVGSSIYQKLIKGWSDRIEKPFVIIPEKCSMYGSTSDMALRVWKSLKKRHPSSGLCVVIDL